MLFQAVSVLALAGAAIAAPAASGAAGGYSPFPLPDGFPNPSPQSIAQIQKTAGGTLPNGPLPPNPGSQAAALDLQVVAFNEIFEVAYFTQLLQNVTENKPGYEVPSAIGKDKVTGALKEIIAQEELHALLANTALKAYGGQPIQPARYMFPVNNLLQALDFAGIFTSIVLGALQGVQTDLTETKSAQLVQVVGSIIGQEGEQTGFYRAVNGRVPSAAPFLTAAPGQFAYNALQQMVIFPGSNPNKINIPAYDPLMITCTPQPKNSTLTFQTTASKQAPTTANYITYISGQNLPVSVPITNIKPAGYNKYDFQASFPFEGGFSNGLTLAALTKGKGPFTNGTQVAMDTVAAPGIIYIK